jgi:hypothetical protein
MIASAGSTETHRQEIGYGFLAEIALDPSITFEQFRDPGGKDRERSQSIERHRGDWRGEWGELSGLC